MRFDSSAFVLKKALLPAGRVAIWPVSCTFSTLRSTKTTLERTRFFHSHSSPNTERNNNKSLVAISPSMFKSPTQ